MTANLILLIHTELLHELFYFAGNILPCIIFLKNILSNDVETNPGEFTFSSSVFANVTSLANGNFHLANLLEARNSIVNYDLMSLCRTSLMTLY